MSVTMSLAFSLFARSLGSLGCPRGSDLGFVSGNLCSELCRPFWYAARYGGSTHPNVWGGGWLEREWSGEASESKSLLSLHLHLLCVAPLWMALVQTLRPASTPPPGVLWTRDPLTVPLPCQHSSKGRTTTLSPLLPMLESSPYT